MQGKDQIHTSEEESDEQLDTVISSIPRSCHLGFENLERRTAHRQLAGGIYRKGFWEDTEDCHS